MKVHRFAVFVVLLGSSATGAAFGQPDVYRGPPGDGARYDTDRRDPDQSPFNSDPYDADNYNDNRYGREPANDVGFFYNELAPYGEWVRSPQYGWAWFPRHVRAGWRPYSLGRWVESDYGWTWVSNEPFGWATYHYGRWAWDRQIGWLWVPGTVWGPAWVAWQQGGGYIGWAPLPPAVGFEAGIGIRLGGLDLRIAIQPRDYAFVDERSFLDRRLTDFIMPPGRNDTLYRNTESFTRYSVVDNRVVNHGVAVDRIEQVTHRRVEHLRTSEARTRDDAGLRSDQLRIYRPRASDLNTVRIGRRNDAGLPPKVSPPAGMESQPAKPIRTDRAEEGPRQVPPDWVAPHRKPEPRDSARQDQQEQKRLEAYEKAEGQRLEQIHQRERAQARNEANAQDVAQRHADEVKAQQEQRQRAQEQLRTQQQIERQAAQSTPERERKPGRQNRPKPEKKNEKNEDKDENGNNGEDHKPPMS